MILEHKGINIFYTDQGQGNTIVLLHGFLENSSMWDYILPQLTKKNRVICIDLLGHGKTGCIGYIHSMELMSETVEALFTHLNINQSIFIGHSMGGYVALAFAEKNPDKLKGLCLMNSTAQADSTQKKQNRDRAILAVKQNHKTFIRMAIGNLFRPKNRILFSKDINNVTNEALKTPLQGIIAALEGMKTRKDRETLWLSSSYKKLLIIGKEDPVLDYKTLIPQTKHDNIKLVEFPDGHMSHIENTYELSCSIMYFIENI